jgi:hypothetical protein
MTNKQQTFSEPMNNNLSYHDDQTEVLTSEGWVYFKDLTLSHKVASLLNNDTLMYQYPFKIHSCDFHGKMYHVKNENIDLLVTPDHGMFVTNPDENKFHIIKAKDLEDKYVEYYRTIKYRNHNDLCVDDFRDSQCNLFHYKVLGAFYMNYIEKHSKSLLMSEKLEELLEELLNHEFFTSKCTFDLESNEITMKGGDYFYSNWNDVYFPNFMSNESIKQNLEFLNGMLLTSSCEDGKSMTGMTKYLSDNIQKLCLHSGKSCDITLCNKEDKTYNVEVQDTSLISVNKNEKEDSWIDYEGKVYCCSVPSQKKNEGLIYVRRNGKPYWNCN